MLTALYTLPTIPSVNRIYRNVYYRFFNVLFPATTGIITFACCYKQRFYIPTRLSTTCLNDCYRALIALFAKKIFLFC